MFFLLKSHAKINLCLKLLSFNGTKHNIFSVMSFLELHDVIKIEENKHLEPSLFMCGKYGSKFDNNNEAEIGKNIVTKSLTLLHNKYKVPTNFDIVIDKQIPVCSGLGGGSSNAATMIDFCYSYHGLNMSKTNANADAFTIGADVPFLMQDSMCITESMGEVLTPLKMESTQSVPVVLVSPAQHCETKKIFQSFASNKGKFVSEQDVMEYKYNISKITNINKLIEYTINIGNDLTNFAMEEVPVIGDILREMKRHEYITNCAMTGSGATCFATCANEEDAYNVAMDIERKFRPASVTVTKLLPSITKTEILPSAKPSMEMIFHYDKDDNSKWIKLA